MKTFNQCLLSMILVAAVPLAVIGDDDSRGGPSYGYGMGMGPGMMHGYGQGMMGPGYGPGMMGGGYGMGRGYYDDDYNPISEKEAKKLFEKFMAKHLKGFTITKIDKQRMPMGTMYWAILKDKSGNEFELHLSPRGYIRGPFVR